MYTKIIILLTALVLILLSVYFPVKFVLVFLGAIIGSLITFGMVIFFDVHEYYKDNDL